MIRSDEFDHALSPELFSNWVDHCVCAEAELLRQDSSLHDSQTLTFLFLLAAKCRYRSYGQNSRDEYLQYASQLFRRLSTESKDMMDNMKTEVRRTRMVLSVLAKGKPIRIERNDRTCANFGIWLIMIEFEIDDDWKCDWKSEQMGGRPV